MSSWFGSGGLWTSFRQGSPGGPGGNGKPLIPPRLMNLLINPFAKSMLAGQSDFQSAVYQWGGIPTLDHGLSPDGPPQWPMVEFTNPALGAFKTGRSRILLPDDFVLLNFFASASVNNVGGFRVMVYDVNRQRSLTIRPCNFNTLAGNGSAPLFLRRPYPFGRSLNNNPPTAKITIVNLENAANSIQFGFYGVIDSDYCQP